MVIRQVMIALGTASAIVLASSVSQASPLAGKAFAEAASETTDPVITLVQALSPAQVRARNARRAERNALGVAVGVGALALGAAAASGAFRQDLPPPPQSRYVYEEEPVIVQRRRPVIYEEPEVVYQPRRRGGEAAAYCAQRFRSYDPRTGTYVGFDGVERACP